MSKYKRMQVKKYLKKCLRLCFKIWKYIDKNKNKLYTLYKYIFVENTSLRKRWKVGTRWKLDWAC